MTGNKPPNSTSSDLACGLIQNQSENKDIISVIKKKKKSSVEIEKGEIFHIVHVEFCGINYASLEGSKASWPESPYCLRRKWNWSGVFSTLHATQYQMR